MFKGSKSETDSASRGGLTIYEKRTGIVFLCIILIFLVFAVSDSFMKEDVLRSEQENRNLCQFVSPDFNSVLDGSWEVGFEEYNKDQLSSDLNASGCTMVFLIFLACLPAMDL